MASEVTVSFKAYLRHNGSQENAEVRRYGVDRDVVSSFTYMKEKLQTVFPSLKGKLFTISWKDGDGDDVLISSDEELIIALTEGKSDVYKLLVDVKGDLKDKPEAMHVEESAVADDLHVGVMCDGCSGVVEGFRYKCTMCQDYDLCSTCESKGIHSEHVMLRLPAPDMLPRFKHKFVDRLAKSMRKVEAKKDEEGHRRSWRGKHGHERHCSPEERREKHGHDKRSSEERGGPSGRQHGGCPMRGHGSRVSFMDILSSYLGENVSKDSMESKEYLKTIGRTVAQFLDPLGIDVNVEVRTDDDTPSSKPAEAEQPNQKASADKQQNVHFAEGSSNSKEAAPSSPEVVCENVEMTDETSQSQVPRRESGDPELEHWTVVNGSGSSGAAAPMEASGPEPVPTAPPVTSASEASEQARSNMARQTSYETAAAMAAAAAAEAHRQASAALQYAGAVGGFATHPGMLYPTLATPPVSQPQQSAPATQVDTARTPIHPDPKITEAVTMMMAMGFSNDGGWLTQLLASKDGDISRALDVLQPVKRT